MRLEFSGAPEITAPRETVWARLMDPDFVAASAPGVESVEAVDPTHFKVITGLGVGAVKVKFKLDIELSDIVELERLRMAARGKAPGSAVDVVSSVRLDEAGSGRTRLNWSATTNVSGTLASVGARLLEGTARRLTEEFWTDFARRVSVSTVG
ncbi:MAG TPA: carbon monoxide dehydrogenase subunit G [Gemmatimonadales bacterium]|jgi:carbon monoxide dehydrogenase subunit G|nr:carbon monoxide dehydrogenase subunit G [Gemmatimonadales bacterium]